MSANRPVTLQDLQAYARKYFPDAFARLPSVDSLRWEPASPNHKNEQPGIQFAAVKLFVGRHQFSQDDMWAHQNLYDPYNIHVGKTGSGPTVEYYYISIGGPFQYAYTGAGHEVDTLCSYYFLAKGLIPHFRPSENALEKFEWAVKSVAQGVALDVPYNNVGNNSTKRMCELQTLLRKGAAARATAKKISADSSQSTAQVQIPATPTATLSGKRKRPAEIPPAALPQPRSYADHVKELFKKQEVEKKKPIDEMRALTTENDRLAFQVQRLQDQLTKAKEMHLDVERAANDHYLRWRDEWHTHGRTLKDRRALRDELQDERRRRQAPSMGAAVGTEMAAEKRRRIDAEKKVASAEKKATDAENNAVDMANKVADAEKYLQDYRTSTEAKVKKVAAFYASQRELLELQLAQVATPEKESILKSFEEEYGELA